MIKIIWQDMLKSYRQVFLKDNTRCARYKVSLHNLDVPWTLFPDDEKEANLIISSGETKQ
jgi:hypothetical protein